MKTHFYTEGRKIPLQEIRVQKLKELKEFMRASTDAVLEAMSNADIVDRLTKLNEIKPGKDIGEMRSRLKEIERTRHFMTWHDLSTVANHSHLVFMITCLYDTACFYTDSEYEQLTGKQICVQAKVETPSVYIVARSSSSDKEQLCYVETREECLQDLSEPLTCESGIKVHDKMKFFHGDTLLASMNVDSKRGPLFLCNLWCKCQSCI